MTRKNVWAILAVLTLVLGCAGGKQAEKKEKKDSKAPEKAVEITPKYDNAKYKGKLALEKDGIYLAHAFDCPGAYSNVIKDRIEDKKGKRLSYTRLVKCNVTGEIHTTRYFGITYNEKGQQSGYQMDISCSKTKDCYRLIIKDIGYDYSWGILNYKVMIGKDTMAFPEPKKPGKK